MPCSDSSSSIYIQFDKDERFVNFDFAKITCGREIEHHTGFSKYCLGKTCQEILNLTFVQAVEDLQMQEEEKQFVLFLEWDCLRTAIAQYLGVDHPDIDKDRSRISAITYDESGISIAQVILPPKELPKILPCSLADS